MTAYDNRLDNYGDPGPVTVPWQVGMEYVLDDVRGERARQRAKWGDDTANDHPDGTDRFGDKLQAESAKRTTDAHAKAGAVTWRDILHEEVREAFAESDSLLLRAELVQVAAVAVKWIEAIDRRVDQ